MINATLFVQATFLMLVMLVVWLLTRFKAGESTLAQRVCSILWIASNFTVPVVMFLNSNSVFVFPKLVKRVAFPSSFYLTFGIAVGGYYTVISMLLENGTCGKIY